jgi:hypothetical protein
MRITIETNESAAVQTSTLAPLTSTPAIDAGPAPVHLVRGANPALQRVAALDAGAPRISGQEHGAPPRPDREPPLNPLRAGAAIAKGIVSSIAADVPTLDAGSAPRELAGKAASPEPATQDAAARSGRTSTKKARNRK